MQFGNTTSTKTSLQRDTALEHLLLGDLLDLLDDPSGPDTHDWLLTIVDALLRLLPREFRSEESGGYLQEVLDEFPSWDRQVQDLQKQHAALHGQLRELRSQIAQSQSSRRLPPRCRFAIYEWLDQVNDHKRQETALLQMAINLEVGVGD